MSTKSKPKKQKRMTLAEDNKLRKKMGLPPVKRITVATIKAEWKKKAKALPKEQRQRVLDMLWEKMTYQDVAESNQIDFETVMGVVELNTEYIPILRKETV